MIQIDADRQGEFLAEIAERCKGKLVSSIDFGLANSSKYAREDGDKVGRFTVFFTDGSRLRVAQDTEPIDDEDEHEEAPLKFEYGKG